MTARARSSAELRDGMTIGIGGWGSRRKPMALVRAILRSDLTDLTVVSLRRPGRRPAVRGRQGPQARLRLRLARLDPARAALPGGPPGRRRRGDASCDEGMFSGGCTPPRTGCRSCRSGPASAPTCMRVNPGLRTVALAVRRTARSWSPCPRCGWTSRWCTSTGPTRTATRQYLGPDPYFDDLFCMAADARVRLVRAIVDDRGADRRRAGPQTLLLSRHDGHRRGRGPERRALHHLRPGLRAATRRSRSTTRPPPPTRRRGARSRRASCPATRPPTRPPSRRCHDGDRSEREQARPSDTVTRAEVLRGRLRRGLARRRRDPRQPDGH